MYCQKCNALMPPNAVFCGKCASPMPKQQIPQIYPRTHKVAPARTWLLVVGIIGIVSSGIYFFDSLTGIIDMAQLVNLQINLNLEGLFGLVSNNAFINPSTMQALYALDLVVNILILFVSIAMIIYRNDLEKTNILFFLGITCISARILTFLIWSIAGPFGLGIMLLILLFESIVPVLLFIGARRNRNAYLGK